MKTVCFILLTGLLLAAFSQENVYWYNISYDKMIENAPGPGLSVDNYYSEKIVTGSRSQQSEVSNDGFTLGNGSLDNAGWCGFFWSQAFHTLYSYYWYDSAKVRGEYRNGFSGVPQCNPGPIYLRIGVADFSRTVSRYNGTSALPLTAVWSDTVNPLQYNMGLLQPGDTLTAEQSIRIDVPASGLDQQFFEIDVSAQIQWIIDNGYTGEYAIVFLTDIGSGSPGKITLYAQENGVLPTPGSSARWTSDGNTMHLVIYGHKTPTALTRSGASLSTTLSASPNPFNPTTCLEYSLEQAGPVSLAVFNARGEKVADLASGTQAAGRHAVTFDAAGLASGMYVCRLTAGKNVQTRKLMLMK